MKVIVLGAGVVGVASAWHLHKAGHEVTVIDRAAGAAEETSHANAGELSYGYTTPWAAPGIPMKALKWLFKAHSPLILRPDGSLFQIEWLWKMLLNCTEKRYKTNKERMVRISGYSRAMFAEFQHEHPDFDFEGRQLGTLQIFRTEQEIDAAQKDIAVLREYGVPCRELKPHECLLYEPGLGSGVHRLAGALHLPDDHTGDCHLFTTRLADMLKARGVTFRFHTPVERLEAEGGKIRAVIAGGQRHEADAFVCALGAFSRPMLKTVGLRLPVYPVKGYSLTVPITDPDAAPQSTVLDETYKVAITRFERRIRIGGMAELSGYQIRLPQKHRQTLERVVRDLFPNGGDLTQSTYWGGLRPMTPDSTPIIGNTRFANLYLNTGHGTLGWTMSMGSGRIIADLVGGRRPEIRTDDLGLSRY